MFGQQPYGELITRLSLSLRDLRQLRQQQQKRRDRADPAQHRLSHVTVLTITAPLDVDETRVMQPQLVLFVVLAAPSLLRLTTLSLAHMLHSSLVAAAGSLGAACPQLTCLRLRRVTHNHTEGEALADLWAVLASLHSLRRLKVSGLLLLGGDEAGLPGLGAIKQLHSLSLKDEELRLQELSQLVGLTKLRVHQVLGDVETPGPHLGALTRLQSLKLFWPNVRAFTASRHLTALRVKFGDADELVSLMGTVRATHTALVRLSASDCTFTVAELLTLPVLREVQCRLIILPQAPRGSGLAVSLPLVRVIKCSEFWGSGEEGANELPPQTVAQTFPQLIALKCGADSEREAELWPDTLAGQLLHLRSFSTIWLSLPEAVARCAVAVESLLVKPRRGLHAPGHLHEVLPSILLLGPRLRRVELRDTDVDNGTLIRLAGTWLQVEEVTIRGVRADAAAVTDVGLSALLRLPRLRQVTLVRCSSITPSAIAALAARWSVERIEVCACKLVGAADVDHVWRLLGRPQLSIVHTAVAGKLPPWAETL